MKREKVGKESRISLLTWTIITGLFLMICITRCLTGRHIGAGETFMEFPAQRAGSTWFPRTQCAAPAYGENTDHHKQPGELLLETFKNFSF